MAAFTQSEHLAANGAPEREPDVCDERVVVSLNQQPTEALSLNEIGLAELESVQPLTLNLYTADRTTGSFVLIDPVTNATAAGGMVRATSWAAEKLTGESVLPPSGPVSAAERAARWGHAGTHLHLAGSPSFTDRAERLLLETGALILTFEPAETPSVTMNGQRWSLAEPAELLALLRQQKLLSFRTHHGGGGGTSAR